MGKVIILYDYGTVRRDVQKVSWQPADRHNQTIEAQALDRVFFSDVTACQRLGLPELFDNERYWPQSFDSRASDVLELHIYS